MRPVQFLFALVLTGIAIAGCTSVQDSTSAPTTSTTSTPVAPPEPVDRPTTIRIGLAVNESAPTAEFDAEIQRILTETMAILADDSSLNVELTTLNVETPGQAEGSIAALVQNGVSVVITGCDDTTIPSVVEAATASQLLAATGCIALPRPDIDLSEGEIDADLFLDLSSLADNARAIASYATTQSLGSLGIIRSTLLPDVERTCLDLQEELLAAGGSSPVQVNAEAVFAELVDAPADVVATLQAAAAQAEGGELDAFVVCALPPTVGDVVASLRAAGFTQPVIVPWYGDTQSWAEDANNVVVITPASRYGDDPEVRTTDLFEALAVDDQVADAVDVVTADALAILVDTALRAESVGSRRLAETIADAASSAEIEGVSGVLRTGGDDAAPVERTYRVISIENGEPAFSTLTSAFDR